MPSKRRTYGTIAAMFVASLAVGSALYLGLSNDGLRQTVDAPDRANRPYGR